jgi:hypothetical protein
MVKFWVAFALLVAAIGTLSNCDLFWMHNPFSFNVNLPSSSGSGGERGSGVEKSEIRKIPPFTKIHAEGAGVLEVDVKPGHAGGSLEISIDDNLLGFITTDVVDGVLEISQTVSLSPQLRTRVKVAVPALESVHLEGANTLNLVIESRNPLELHLEGAGRIKASGKVGPLSVHSEGAGNVEAGELVSPSVEVTIEGAGKARVHATESLKAHIAGAGKITYLGDPKTVEKNIEGIGRIARGD